jgi:hypothetical protein
MVISRTLESGPLDYFPSFKKFILGSEPSLLKETGKILPCLDNHPTRE